MARWSFEAKWAVVLSPAEAWCSTAGRISAFARPVVGVALILVGTVGGGFYAELTLAYAPSHTGVFVSSLLFVAVGLLGVALVMSAVVEAMAGRWRRPHARVLFWFSLAAFALPAVLAVVLGRDDLNLLAGLRGEGVGRGGYGVFRARSSASLRRMQSSSPASPCM